MNIKLYFRWEPNVIVIRFVYCLLRKTLRKTYPISWYFVQEN